MARSAQAASKPAMNPEPFVDADGTHREGHPGREDPLPRPSVTSAGTPLAGEGP